MIFPEFDALLDCYPKIIVAHFVPELIPLQSSFNALQNMSTGKAYGPKRKQTSPGRGKKAVVVPKSSLAASLDQVQLLTWRDFNISMDMGATLC